MHSSVEDLEETFQSYLKLLELNIVKNVTVKKEAQTFQATYFLCWFKSCASSEYSLLESIKY